MADVTRAEFDALVARVKHLEGKAKPKPKPTSLVLRAPVVSVSPSGFYSVSASLTANTAYSATYLQLAVRGPGAQDLDLRPSTTLAAGQTLVLSGSAHGDGDYSAWIAISSDGKTWLDGPRTTFTVTATAPVHTPLDTPTDRTVGRFSQLPFNSLVFRILPADAEDFGRRRGTPVDGLLMFSGRGGWGDFNWVPDGTAQYVQSGHLVVNSMPHAPESEGDQMNQRGADDAYRDEQRALGKHIADAGLNSPLYTVRVDWECNGDWYAWSANRPGGADALREAIKNYVVNLRAGGATKVRFDLCFNKGPSQAGHDFDIFPGAEYIDVIGIDQYDMWAPSYNDADWAREMTKGPSIRTAAQFAAEHQIMWSWDEGGNTHGDENQGGDNPVYWRLVRTEIDRNIANCAWHNTYDDPGAPSSLAHDFDHNPASWPVYKKLWSPA